MDIKRLLEDDGFYREMKERALKQAEKFNWEMSARKLVNIFNKC
jgi:glycosyltransferase involved in cell wall biosynthesis